MPASATLTAQHDQHRCTCPQATLRSQRQFATVDKIQRHSPAINADAMGTKLALQQRANDVAGAETSTISRRPVTPRRANPKQRTPPSSRPRRSSSPWTKSSPSNPPEAKTARYTVEINGVPHKVLLDGASANIMTKTAFHLARQLKRTSSCQSYRSTLRPRRLIHASM